MKKNTLVKKIILLSSVVVLSWTALATEPVYSEMKRFNMSYIYFGNPQTYSSYVARTNNSLHQISPNYFNIKENGDLDITYIEKNFINEMHKKDIKVIPFLSNHWDRNLGRLALENKTKLVKDIARAIEDYNLDGINVDIENLTGDDRDIYSEFVKMLRKALPSDKIISVAVAPNPFNFETGWQKSYDYEALAKYSDYLVIMTYDESYPGGPSGPVASISFVEKSIQYAIKRVPSEKIVLGIPFFGRYWKEGEKSGGAGISLTKVENLLKQYDHTISYDEKAQSPKAIVTINENDPKPTVNYTEMKPGKYTFWYENDKSIKAKLKLVEKYNLGGTANWSLGQELKETWNYYDLWLNGYHFIDTNNHWAEQDIFDVEKKGWMKGKGKDIFSPEDSLTRAQAAVTLVRALDLNDNGGDNVFKDVSKNHWASKEINTAKSNGIIFGNDKGEFNPEDSVTREEMAAMLDRILEELKYNSKDNIKFKDISKSDWSYESIMKLVENDIFEGYEDGAFRPKDSITRAQMAALMNRISAYLE